MSTFSGNIGPEEEDGAGWGGLVPTKAERAQEALEFEARRGRALVAAVNKALGEALAGAESCRGKPSMAGVRPEWDDGYVNGIKACAAVVQAAMHFAAPATDKERLTIAALKLAVQAMRAPLDDWKGELERKALDAARAVLGAA